VYAGNSAMSFIDPSGAEAIVEYATTLARGLQISELFDAALTICETVGNIQLALSGINAVSNFKGAIGEDIAQTAYANNGDVAIKPTKTVPGPVTGKPRLPDLGIGQDLAEVKNTAKQGLTSQIRDSIALAQRQGGKLTLITRVDTKLSRQLLKAAAKGGLRIVACLPSIAELC
jgi:hypothetical protein